MPEINGGGGFKGVVRPYEITGRLPHKLSGVFRLTYNENFFRKWKRCMNFLITFILNDVIISELSDFHLKFCESYYSFSCEKFLNTDLFRVK